MGTIFAHSASIYPRIPYDIEVDRGWRGKMEVDKTTLEGICKRKIGAPFA